MGSISSLGIGSGFLNNDLLDDIISSNKSPIENRLKFEKRETEAKLSGFGQFQSAVSALEKPAEALTDPTAMRSFKGESSDEAVGVEVDDAVAQKGSYQVNVNQLAQAQSLASGTYADKDSTSVGQGTLTISVGDNTTDVTIDDSNNTLQGIADAVNNSDAGVSAGIIDTGDGYRMVLSSDETGTANAASITVNDSDGNNTDTSGLSAFAFNGTTKNLTETAAAKDAKLNVSGVDITRSSNTVEGVVEGVTLNLNSVTDTAASVDITQDLSGPAKKVQSLVQAFNKVQDVADKLTGFDQETGEGSLLTGDSTIRTTMNQLRRDLGQIVPGLEDASVRSLSDIGISTDFNTGKLEFDSTKFKEELKKNPDDVTALFANQGRASDGQVEFVRSTSSTQVGEYDINVDSLATRATYTADSALADNTTIDGSNDTFTLNLNGDTEAQITLTQDTYATPQDLLNEIQTQIDNNSAIEASDDSVQVSLNANDKLVFTSQKYGSESSVEITEANSTLGLSAREGQAGTDVQGTIDGKQAEGDGRVLFLGSDQGDASGIQVQINGGNTGARGAVSYIEGVGNSIEERISQLQGSKGALSSREESFQDELEEISEERQELNERMNNLRERLSSQFASADARISQFQQTGNFLEQQLAGLMGNNN